MLKNKGSTQDAMKVICDMATLKGHTVVEVCVDTYVCENCATTIVYIDEIGIDVGSPLITRCGGDWDQTDFDEVIDYLRANYEGKFY